MLHIVFTSGTTGRPKGVVMSHRAVVAFFHGMLAEAIVTPTDRVASTSPLQFDFSLLDIGLALGSGAAVVPVPRGLVRWPRRLLGFLEDCGVTHVNAVPSMWRPVLHHEFERLSRLTSLRGVLFCGEPFPLTELRALQRALPGARLVNCYGATESMACSFADVPNPLPADLERLSIGRAHRGAEILLLDDEGRPVSAPGEIGEIHLRSPALFTGYWADPDATARTLVPDPLNPGGGTRLLRSGDLAYRGPAGEHYYVGRADLQVKIRGNRVELGEVERCLSEHPRVSCAVALVDGTGPTAALRAFVVPEPGQSPVTAEELRLFCRESLPEYMVPEHVDWRDELPVTSHGKVDRTALAASLPATVSTVGVR
jgi:acyl-coenzyme A synthetase/AMP-(fatty) acid ligase